MILNLDNLPIVADYTGTVTFDGEGAGYRNTLGMYQFDENGRITGVEIIFANASQIGSGGWLKPGVSSVDINFEAGSSIGFFIIPNGASYRTSTLLNDESGTFELRNADGKAVDANFDGAVYLWHINEDGKETKIQGQYNGITWHSTGSDLNGYGMNGDDFAHTRWELVKGDTGLVLQMGFEDLWHGGDADFNDVMFTVDIGAENIQAAEEASLRPDLVVRDLSISTTAPEEGEDMYLTVAVANIGEADSNHAATTFYWSPTDSFDARTAVELDSEGHGSIDLGETLKGEQERLQYSQVAELGTGYIFGVIGETADISEENLDNNVSAPVRVTFEDITDRADLQVDNFRVSDTTLEQGQDIFVALEVSNSGAAHVDTTGTTIFWSPTATYNPNTAVEVGYDGHGEMKAGETDHNGSDRIRYEDVAELGDGYLIAVVDAERDVREISETNNASDAIAITFEDAGPAAQADLTVTNLQAENADLAVGDDLELSIDVANIGEVDVAGVRTTYYWSEDAVLDASDIVIATDHHGRLKDGETETGEETRIRYEELTELGDGFIFAVVDQKDVVDESNEANNVSGPLAVTVGEATAPDGADLVIQNIALEDATLRDGEDLFVELDVANVGDVDARSTTTTIFWSPTDDFDAETAVMLEIDNHGLLRGGEVETEETTRVRYEDLEDLGDGYIIAMINANGSIGETANGNNLSDGVAFDLL